MVPKFRNPQNHHWAAKNANQRLIEGSLERYCTISFHRQRCLQKCASLLHGTARTKARFPGNPGFVGSASARTHAHGQRTLFSDRPRPTQEILIPRGSASGGSAPSLQLTIPRKKIMFYPQEENPRPQENIQVEPVTTAAPFVGWNHDGAPLSVSQP